MFDASLHLAFKEPTERITMESTIGVTSPFQLCSLEGVTELRRDIFQPKVVKNHLVYSTLAGTHAQLRGMASTDAKFVRDFWKSPEALAAVSKAAGCELVPVFDYELGHVNIQIPKGRSREDFCASLKADSFESPVIMPQTPPAESDEEGRKGSMESEQLSAMLEATEDEETHLVVGWHCDAYPWVCVLMLSDLSNMKGGETAILKPDGSVLKAIGPQIGFAVLMQMSKGSSINHAALPCTGNAERITMVTSFRAKAPRFKDISNLDNIRSCSNWFDLYDQWTQSRLELAQERIAEYSNRLVQRRLEQEEEATKTNPEGAKMLLTRPTVDLDEFDEFLNDLANLLFRSRDAMLPYSDPTRVF